LIYGTGAPALHDSVGRLIDGNHDGTAGGNATAILGRKGVTPSAIALARRFGPKHVRAGAF
jgi:hypothetical protein